MRVNKYRGRRSYDKKWIYGNLLIDRDGDFHIVESEVIEKDGHHIQIDSDFPMFFDNETVGQFTGLHDKNGVEIYEGDIIYGTIKGLFGQGYQNGIVRWGEYGFVIDLQKQSWEPGIGMVGFCSFEDFEVIGNIHENKEV